jgi:hypothetical protein
MEQGTIRLICGLLCALLVALIVLRRRKHAE